MNYYYFTARGCPLRQTHTHTHTHTHTQSLSLSHTHTHTLTQSLSLSLSHTRTHSHTHTCRAGAAAKPRPPGLFKHRVCFTLQQYHPIEGAAELNALNRRSSWEQCRGEHTNGLGEKKNDGIVWQKEEEEEEKKKPNKQKKQKTKTRNLLGCGSTSLTLNLPQRCCCLRGTRQWKQQGAAVRCDRYSVIFNAVGTAADSVVAACSVRPRWCSSARLWCSNPPPELGRQ